MKQSLLTLHPAAGVDPRTIRNPDLPDLQTVFTNLLDWVDQLLQPGQTPVIIGYNSHTYDFKVLGRNLAALSPPMQVGQQASSVPQ